MNVPRLTTDPAGDVVAPRVRYLEEWIRDCQRYNRNVSREAEGLRAKVRDLEILVGLKNAELLERERDPPASARRPAPRRRRAEPAMSVNIACMTKQPIDPAVKRRLHRISALVETSTADRDEMICNLYAEGHSLREIAEACGTITHSGVARIVKR